MGHQDVAHSDLSCDLATRPVCRSTSDTYGFSWSYEQTRSGELERGFRRHQLQREAFDY